MSQNSFFVSHSSLDKDLVSQFGLLLRKITLNQIQPWFSSDAEHAGGLQPGELWFDRIKERMAASSSVIAVVTRNSVISPWVFFESGFGVAVSDKKLILVTHGIASMAEIPEPLSRWQAFRIDKPEGLREFCEKLLGIYDISFDEVLFDAHSRNFISDTSKSEKLSQNDLPQKQDKTNQALLDHFDRRFFELTSQLRIDSPYINYTIDVENGFDQTSCAIEIAKGTSVEDVLDAVWSSISSHVYAYTYMEKWILVESTTNLKLVVREVQHLIPASEIFKPGSVWTAVGLQAPYSPLESNAKRRG
jgi:TIR domain